MSFLIAAYSSFTGRLYKAALESPSPLHLPVLIEGPYGSHSADLLLADTLVLIGGGTGVALVQNIWEATLQRFGRHKADPEVEGARNPRRLIVYWIVREQRE